MIIYADNASQLSIYSNSLMLRVKHKNTIKDDRGTRVIFFITRIAGAPARDSINPL